MKKTKQQGLTLLELIITIAIVSILVTLAVPSFTNSIQDNNLASYSNALISEFEVARSEAIKRNVAITVCVSSNSTSCETTNTSDWETGRLVFIDNGAGDAGNANNGTIDTGETILYQFDSASTGITLTPTLLSANSHITFYGDGTVNSSGTLVICDERGNADNSLAEAININLLGQAKKAYDSNETTDHVVNNIQGDNVTCA